MQVDSRRIGTGVVVKQRVMGNQKKEEEEVERKLYCVVLN